RGSADAGAGERAGRHQGALSGSRATRSGASGTTHCDVIKRSYFEELAQDACLVDDDDPRLACDRREPPGDDASSPQVGALATPRYANRQRRSATVVHGSRFLVLLPHYHW